MTYNTCRRFVTCYNFRAGSAGLYLVQVGAPNAAESELISALFDDIITVETKL